MIDQFEFELILNREFHGSTKLQNTSFLYKYISKSVYFVQYKELCEISDI